MSSSYQCTQEDFLKEIDGRAMTVMRNDGLSRHIRFKRPGSSTYWFDLITWPGTLCIDGDMGTYVFRRLDDMFEFFRTDSIYWDGGDKELRINPGYWGEKLQAMPDKGFKEFSPALFRANVKDYFDNWVESNQPNEDDKPEVITAFDKLKATLWEDLENEVLLNDHYSDCLAISAAMDFECSDVPSFNMHDFYEHRNTDYTTHFIWCCYAIAWGIKTYDQSVAISQGGAL